MSFIPVQLQTKNDLNINQTYYINSFWINNFRETKGGGVTVFMKGFRFPFEEYKIGDTYDYLKTQTEGAKFEFSIPLTVIDLANEDFRDIYPYKKSFSSSSIVEFYEDSNGLVNLSIKEDEERNNIYIVQETIAQVLALIPTASQLDGTGIYYVSQFGDDSNDGSYANPFLTIGFAQSVANAGDTIIVRSGLYVGERDLGKGFVTYRFEQGTTVRVLPGFSLWVSALGGYRVEGFATFETETGLLFPTTNFISWNQSTSNIYFECDRINVEVSNAVFYIFNAGFGIDINVHFEIQQLRQNGFNQSKVFYLAGGGGAQASVNINCPYVYQNDYSTAFPNSTAAERGATTVISFASYDVNINIDNSTNSGLGTSPNTYIRTGFTGTCTYTGKITQSFPLYSFVYAGCYHQGGRLIGEDMNIEVTNGSGYYANSLNVTNYFEHRSGIIETITNGNAIRLHDTLARTYSFNGEYKTPTGVLQTIVPSGNVTGSVLSFGDVVPFKVYNDNAAGRAITATTAYTLKMYYGFIFCTDVASASSIYAGAAVNVPVYGAISSNVDKNINVTLLNSAKYSFDNLLSY